MTGYRLTTQEIQARAIRSIADCLDVETSVVAKSYDRPFIESPLEVDSIEFNDLCIRLEEDFGLQVAALDKASALSNEGINTPNQLVQLVVTAMGAEDKIKPDELHPAQALKM